MQITRYVLAVARIQLKSAAMILLGIGIASVGSGSKVGFAQQGEPPNRGVAAAVGGVGRLDIRVLDESDHPVNRAYAVFTSKQIVGRKKGGACDSWDYTNEQGYVVLPPLQIGELSLMVYKKPFKRLFMSLQPDQLGSRVIVRLKK